MLTPSQAPQQSGSSFLSQRGICFPIGIGFSDSHEPWIIDSEATDHMTNNSNLFTSYIPSLRNIKIRIANGTFSAIVGTRDVQITPNITLKSTLHVPKLTCNLLSINKITQDLNCLVQLSYSDCVFQDHSGKKIGNAKEHGGIYYFEEDFDGLKQVLTAYCGSTSMGNYQK